jgi:large subunit ribosomal protein L32
MANPKWKTSKSKKGMRRSHHALKPQGLSTCKNCSEIHLPHTACPSCGHYDGRQVMDPKVASVASSDFSVE